MSMASPSHIEIVMPTIAFTRTMQRFLTAPFARVSGSTVGEALGAALASRSTLRGHVLDDGGALQDDVAVHVNGRPVSDRVGLSDPVGPRDEIYVFQMLVRGALTRSTCP